MFLHVYTVFTDFVWWSLLLHEVSQWPQAFISFNWPTFENVYKLVRFSNRSCGVGLTNLGLALVSLHFHSTVQLPTKRERKVWHMNTIICEPYRQMCLYMRVMVDQREALAITTRLTDTVYLVHPTGIPTVNPWVSIAATLHFTTIFMAIIWESIMAIMAIVGDMAIMVGWVMAINMAKSNESALQLHMACE